MGDYETNPLNRMGFLNCPCCDEPNHWADKPTAHGWRRVHLELGVHPDLDRPDILHVRCPKCLEVVWFHSDDCLARLFSVQELVEVDDD